MSITSPGPQHWDQSVIRWCLLDTRPTLCENEDNVCDDAMGQQRSVTRVIGPEHKSSFILSHNLSFVWILSQNNWQQMHTLRGRYSSPQLKQKWAVKNVWWATLAAGEPGDEFRWMPRINYSNFVPMRQISPSATHTLCECLSLRRQQSVSRLNSFHWWTEHFLAWIWFFHSRSSSSSVTPDFVNGPM